MSRSSECKHKQERGHILSHKSPKDKKSSSNSSYLKNYSLDSRAKRRKSSEQSDHCESDHNHNDGGLSSLSGEKIFKSKSTSRSKTSTPRHKRRISLPVRVSCIEIFNEEFRDMLSRDPSARLKVVERPDVSSYIKGLTTFVANDPDDIDSIITIGNKNRVFGATALKPQSLSHAVYTITTGTMNLDFKGRKHAAILSHFHFIDIAGSEEHIKIETNGRLPKEGGKINLPLSILANTFSAVGSSTWTRMQFQKSTVVKVLSGLIGCNAETDICSVVGETPYETASELHCCSKKKNICSKQRRSRKRSKEDQKDALIHRYKKEIEHLQKQLDADDGVDHIGNEDEYSRLQAEEIEITQKLEQIQSMIADAQLEHKEACAENQQEMKGFLNNLHHLNKELSLQETLIRVYIGEKYKVS